MPFRARFTNLCLCVLAAIGGWAACSSGEPPPAQPDPIEAGATQDAGTTTGDADTPRDGATGPDATTEEDASSDAGLTPRDAAAVFFSGHSLLDNPMPDYVASIAESQGKSFAWNQQNIPGSPLRVRTWGSGGWEGYRQGKNRSGSGMNVVDELASPQTLGAGGRYDSLLVTDRHDILGVIQWENTVGYLRHFHDRLIAGNPEATTYFYQTWLDVDKANPAPWIDYEKKALVAWECVSSKVNHTLEAENRSDRIRTIPGGAALVELVERALAGEVAGIEGSTAQRLDRIFSDNVHLTDIGIYFMASVHHAALFGDTPVGAAGPSGANAETVRDLQTIAWRFVRDYYAQPGAGTRSMEECRARIPSDVCPGFWTLLGQPQNIAGCQSYFGNATPGADGQPFVWPDARFTPLPAP